jgi:hypothetical protein
VEGSLHSKAAVMMDYIRRKIRRWKNYCYVELRPLRHQLRNPAVRAALLKWAATGTVIYVSMYVIFYIAARHTYLLGFSDYSTDLLMEQYERDLEVCWHNPPVTNNVTSQLSLADWNANLRVVELDQALQDTETQIIGLVQGIRRSERTVLSVPSGYETGKVSPAALRKVLDAGACVGTRTDGNSDSNRSSLRGLLEDQQTSEIRCLPSFIIAGAMKCGTGELMKWLQLHPKLALGTGNGDQREVHYFTSALSSNARGPNHGVITTTPGANEIVHPVKLLDYVQFFPAFTPAEAREKYTFEKSPDYIRDHTALRNIHALLPSVKIVLLLRNPSLRALSEFNHHCRHGRYARVTKDMSTPVTNSAGNGVRRYQKGDVVRIDNSPAGSVLPKSSYEVLDYPCSAEDAERYFTTSVQRVSGGAQPRTKTRGRLLRESNTTIETTSAATGNVTAAADGQELHHLVPELEHGFYEHQLRRLLEL